MAASEKKPPGVAGFFIPTMHGLRGAAILVILLFHIAIGSRWIPHHAVPQGYLEGAFLALNALFFTTGFVLFLPVVKEGRFGSVKAFAVRRFARIAPPYYVCILVILVTFPLLTSQASAAAAANGPLDYLAHFTFLQRELLLSDAGLGVNGPLWALSMDLAFYVVLPFIAAAYLRRPLVGLGVALGISLAWRLLVNEPATEPDLLIQFPLFAVDFGAGMTAAWALIRLQQVGAPRFHPGLVLASTAAAAAAILGLVYAAGAAVPYHAGVFQGSDAANLAFPLALGAFMVAISLAPKPAQWPLANRAALWFSEVSFSVYLYHVMVINFALFTLEVPANGSPRSLVTLALIVIPWTLALAYLSYRYVELPSRRYGREMSRRFGRGRAPETGAAGARAAALGAAPDRV